MVVHWVSGHVSVKGNERADELAKGAVQEIGARLKVLQTGRGARSRRGMLFAL